MKQLKEMLEELKPLEGKDFVDKVMEHNSGKVTGVEEGDYYEVYDYVISIDDEDILEYAKNKGIEIDFDENDDDYKEYVWEIYCKIEEEFTDYIIVNSKDDIIGHLEKKIEYEEW